jgi:hypothetical protein
MHSLSNNRPNEDSDEDVAQTEPAEPEDAQICDYIVEAMAYPSSWIRPGSVFNGLLQILAFIALFWGAVLYLCIWAAWWGLRGAGLGIRRISLRLR